MVELQDARYYLLETYRADGRAVRTPLWAVGDDDELCMWTGGHSFKVKRIRRNPKVAVAPCNARGSKTLGEFRFFHAQVVEEASAVAAIRARLRRKYGWQLTLIEASLKLRRLNALDYVGLRLRPSN